jgi:eukaryotic-like serine/threonine-protein kinase
VLERIGNCRIIEEIASGGMAVVYKAVQESLNRTVAVKALKTQVADDAQFAIRFEREALSLAQLQHENIIHIYDFYKERGAFFIVLEYVEGIDLYDLLDRCGRLPVDVAAIIAMQVARALDYAHYCGIIHRDIKPANIMVSRSGGVKLMDFGIARDQSFEDLTQTGTGVGTPSYMSPEQILGDRLDFRSDIFSLGIVLYQMVTGRKPFIEDEHRSVMHKIRVEKAPSPRRLNPEVPRELERILSRCMQKGPRDRYRSTQDLVLALERFLSRRVEMNYHARLVQFLKVTGIITAEQAQQYLPAASTASGPSSPGQGAGRDLVRKVAMVQAIIAAAVTMTVVLIHLAPVGAGPSSRPQAIVVPSPTLSVPERPRGRVRVVVNPWAEVWVDGKLVDTTPFAVPLDLEAGTHRLSLRNPYYDELDREVTIAEGDASGPLILHLSGRRTTPGRAAPLEPRRVVPDAAAQRPTLTHTVRKGDTFELLAAEYYGSRDFGVFVLLANGLAHPRPLRPGERLAIPTAWKYRIVEGDTLTALAQRLLGDQRRAAFLAENNNITLQTRLSIGDELTIPFHATHEAAAREELGALAATYYRDPAKAELLRRYNFRPAGKPLAKGDTIIVPLFDVHARMPEDPEAEKRARRQRAMGARAREALPRAQEAWRIGDYAAVRAALVELDHALLDADTGAATTFLLGEAYVALGDRDSARRMFAIARERRPDLLIRPDERSPKICEEWKRAGGKVEELR